ncbi:hypothetical protein N7452_000102 [Penicillium brevicompactum]|uniref:Uncharacterized protein n=1 Tax=Penicillium brevicompactum TaxID=5074 RepID=A0A9W9UN18_PENBR|nr:hypothetical protein N7452_000102 [Penicillium brevicompactum]
MPTITADAIDFEGPFSTKLSMSKVHHAADLTMSPEGRFPFQPCINGDLKPPGACAMWIMKSSERCPRPPIAPLLQHLEPKQEPAFRNGWAYTSFYRELSLSERSIEAGLMQVVGDLSPIPCVACQLKLGPFSHCIRVENVDCCANCWSINLEELSFDAQEASIIAFCRETFRQSSLLDHPFVTSQHLPASPSLEDEYMQPSMGRTNHVDESHNMDQMYQPQTETSLANSTGAENIQDQWPYNHLAVRSQDTNPVKELGDLIEEYVLLQQGVDVKMGLLLDQMDFLLQQQDATAEMSSLIDQMRALLRKN